MAVLRRVKPSLLLLLFINFVRVCLIRCVGRNAANCQQTLVDRFTDSVPLCHSRIGVNLSKRLRHCEAAKRLAVAIQACFCLSSPFFA